MKLARNKHTWLTLMTAAILMFTTGCSSDGGSSEEPQPEATTAPIILTISTPKAEQSRVSDPGDSIQEVYEDWNRLTIIVAYKEKTTGIGIVDPEPKKMIYMDTFTKEQFKMSETQDVTLKNGSTLSKADAYGNRTYTMYIPQGTVNAYGVTYPVDETTENKNSKLGFDPVKELKDKASSTEAQENASGIVEALTISNDYAGTDLKKFLSVATGYATILDAKGNSTNERDLKIIKGNEAMMKKYWRMPLTRLATKLDIQWDAEGAYEKDEDDEKKLVYTNVQVSSFQYVGGAKDGTKELNAKGSGRLFPSLQKPNTTNGTTSEVTPLGGTVSFYNHSEISKRNGRVYHYVYPDGSKSPTIRFHIDATPKNADGTDGTKRSVNYTLNFSETNKFPFQQASWYKINISIKGSSQTNSEIYVK